MFASEFSSSIDPWNALRTGHWQSEEELIEKYNEIKLASFLPKKSWNRTE